MGGGREGERERVASLFLTARRCAAIEDQRWREFV
jgi:hypothetical protein